MSEAAAQPEPQSGAAESIAPLAIDGFDIDEASGCLTAIHAGEHTWPVSSWGAEFGDWKGTFAQHLVARGGSLGCATHDWQVDRVTQNAVSCAGRIELPSGVYRYEGSDRLVKGMITRDYALAAEDEPAALGDFVARCAFDGATWPDGEIAGQRVRYEAKNLLRQHPVSEAALGQNRFKLRSEIIEVDVPDGMDTTTYLRDDGRYGWVIHHRLITSEPASTEFVLRFRRKTWSSHRHRLIGLRPVRRLLWRWAERNWNLRIPTTQICGNLLLHPGQPCRLKVRLSILPR